MSEVDWRIRGSAYERPQPSFEDGLVRVGRGTPSGEMLRRYWHPIAVASEVGELPEEVSVLGEKLVLFKTPEDGFGLVYPRCVHRGTELIYGRVEARGIRCCYHGWLFDTEGRCLERPCEPPDKQIPPPHYRQPWYPVQERYGLVFAYLGPPERQPVLPRYDILEEVAEGMEIVADGNSIGSGGPALMPCNWFQTHENVMDPLHVYVLHSSFSTRQFGELMAQRPEVTFEETEHGVISHQLRSLPDGRTMDRITEVILPNLRIVADPTLTRLGAGDNISWTLPLDDTSTRIFTAMKWPVGEHFPYSEPRPMYGGKTWFELDERGHQEFPGDYEAQVSQGAITWHSEEHLATSDRGIAIMRQQFRRAVSTVARGDDPPGVSRNDAEPVTIRCGNFVPEA